MSANQQSPDSDIAAYVAILVKRRRIVILVWMLVFSLMAAYAYLTAPVYEATALVSVDRPINDPAATHDTKEDGDALDGGYYDTEFKLINSDTQLRRVWDELELQKTPELARGGLKALREMVVVLQVPHTRLAQVSVESTNAALAAKIASTLAHDFAKRNLDNQLYMSKNMLQALQKGTNDAATQRLIEELPAVVENKLIQDIKTQIFNSEAQLADLKTRYTSNYPEVQALESKLASMRKVRDHEMANILGSVKTELSGQLRANNVRVVDEPQIPQTPIRPRKMLALALSVPLGLALGLLAAFLLETFDQTVQTHSDVEQRLGMAFLGQIPAARRKKGATIFAPLVSPDVTPSSEAFRNLRTVLDLSSRAAEDPFLLVTSTVQAEGKSFVATNLAVALSQLGQKVLIIDGDLRRPNQHLNLSSGVKLGLSDYLAGGVTDAAHVAQKTAVENLELVTCGSRPKNPSELLNAQHLAKLLAWARGRYQRVIVDCPPVFPVSDVLLWGKHVNSTIFVARSGHTRVPLIKTACARLRLGGVKIVGGVINGARTRTTRYADGRYADFY